MVITKFLKAYTQMISLKCQGVIQRGGRTEISPTRKISPHVVQYMLLYAALRLGTFLLVQLLIIKFDYAYALWIGYQYLARVR